MSSFSIISATQESSLACFLRTSSHILHTTPKTRYTHIVSSDLSKFKIAEYQDAFEFPCGLKGTPVASRAHSPFELRSESCFDSSRKTFLWTSATSENFFLIYLLWNVISLPLNLTFFSSPKPRSRSFWQYSLLCSLLLHLCCVYVQNDMTYSWPLPWLWIFYPLGETSLSLILNTSVLSIPHRTTSFIKLLVSKMEHILTLRLKLYLAIFPCSAPA